MKLKTIYSCQQCGFQSPKWLGKCPNCATWSSFLEDVISISSEKKASLQPARVLTPTSLAHQTTQFARLQSNIKELDRVLGGGIVKGSLILLGGEPGIGKSTLTIQICNRLSQYFSKILYISGEESIEQISLRAKRLSISSEKIQLLNETGLENILATLEQEKPDFVIIDSIQVIKLEGLNGSPGSLAQIRQCTETLMKFAKSTSTPVILIGHVTKEGELAGPKVLEHLVDTVLNLEGDRYQHFRILRSLKNRFGATNEVGIFEMTENGMQEVANPQAAFLNQHDEPIPGSCISCCLEGARVLLVEIQALTTTTVFGYPRRTASGYDINRLHILIGVLQKHLNLNLLNQDVYVNVAGGLQIDDPASDLAVALAIISSFQKIALLNNALAIGEIGLGSEIRPVTQLEKRLQEAARLGIKTIYGPCIKKPAQFSGNYISLKTIRDYGTSE